MSTVMVWRPDGRWLCRPAKLFPPRRVLSRLYRLALIRCATWPPSTRQAPAHSGTRLQPGASPPFSKNMDVCSACPPRRLWMAHPAATPGNWYHERTRVRPVGALKRKGEDGTPAKVANRANPIPHNPRRLADLAGLAGGRPPCVKVGSITSANRTPKRSRP